MNKIPTQKKMLPGLAVMALLCAALPLRAEDAPADAQESAAQQFQSADAALTQAVHRQVAAMATAAPTPTALPSPRPAQRYIADLASLYNRQFYTSLSKEADGMRIYATGGMNPAQPEKSYLVLLFEGQGAVIFDIRGFLSLTQHVATFRVGSLPLMLIGDSSYTSPEDESTFTLATYKRQDGKPVPETQLLKFTTKQLKVALYSLGQELRFGSEEYRLFYGDSVTRNADNHFQLGPGKGLVFAQRYADGSYNNDPVILDAAALAGGKTVTLALSKQTTVTLRRGADTLEIAQTGGH